MKQQLYPTVTNHLDKAREQGHQSLSHTDIWCETALINRRRGHQEQDSILMKKNSRLRNELIPRRLQQEAQRYIIDNKTVILFNKECKFSQRLKILNIKLIAQKWLSICLKSVVNMSCLRTYITHLNPKQSYLQQLLFYLFPIICRMEPDLHYMKHSLNTSAFRNTCRFSKASRFKSNQKTPTDYNYNIRSKPNSRSCSFGIGNRLVMVNSMAAPAPNRYNVVCFPNDKRATSLGESRSNAVFRSINKQVQKKAELPSPNAYSTMQRQPKNGFSLRMRLPGQIEISVKKRVPGPGQYQPVQMCTSGRYVSSKIRNTRCISFGLPKRENFKRSSGLGPGSYDIFNADSSFSKTRILNMKRNRSKNFGSGRRSTLQDRSKSFVPGPGNYQSFSLFGDQ